MKRILAVATLFFMFSFSAVSQTTEELQAQITALLAQLQALQAQLATPVPVLTTDTPPPIGVFPVPPPISTPVPVGETGGGGGPVVEGDRNEVQLVPTGTQPNDLGVEVFLETPGVYAVAIRMAIWGVNLSPTVNFYHGFAAQDAAVTPVGGGGWDISFAVVSAYPLTPIGTTLFGVDLGETAYTAVRAEVQGVVLVVNGQEFSGLVPLQPPVEFAVGLSAAKWYVVTNMGDSYETGFARVGDLVTLRFPYGELLAIDDHFVVINAQVVGIDDVDGRFLPLTSVFRLLAVSYENGVETVTLQVLGDWMSEASASSLRVNAAGLSSASGEASELLVFPKLGDINGDTRIDFVDVITILAVLNGKYFLSPSQMLAADVSGSKGGGPVISLLDAVLALQYVYGLISEFPVAGEKGAPSLSPESEAIALQKGIALLEAKGVKITGEAGNFKVVFPEPGVSPRGKLPLMWGTLRGVR